MFSRTKSVGRFARSVEIITHRPTMGSFLSSGTPMSFPLENCASFAFYAAKEAFRKQLDLRAGITTVIVYADNIESPLAPSWHGSQVFPNDFGDLPPFVPVHR